jgi:ABC-2 type transport system permease protein
VLRAALLILGKDLRLRLRDRSVLLFGVIVPLGLTVVFSLIFPETEEFELPAAVVDLDGGPIAAAFVDDLLPELIAAEVVVPVAAEDEAAARELLESGDISAAWILPAGMSDAVAAGRGAQIEVLVNPDRALAAEVAQGVARGFATRIDEVTLAVATAAVSGVPAEQLEAVGQRAAASEPLVAIEPLVAEDAQLDPISYLAAGMAAFFVFFTVQYGVTGLLEERQQGTMPRLLAAPIPPAAIQVGKAAGAFFLGVVSTTVLAIGSRLLLGAYWGPAVGTAILIVALVVSATGPDGVRRQFRPHRRAGRQPAVDRGGQPRHARRGLLPGRGRIPGHPGCRLPARLVPAWPRGPGRQRRLARRAASCRGDGALRVVAAVPAVLRLRKAIRW